MLSIRAAALSDNGRVRSENEERFLFDEKARLFGVADGVGGLPGGGEAAQLAVEEIVEALRQAPADTDPDLVTVVEAANQAVATLGLKMSPAMGIGTTLTFGCVRKNAFKIAHVGDSRCYAARKGQFIQLT